MKTINSYALRLTGKAESPEPLEIGNNYHIALEGSVVSATESDNDDGNHSVVYVFRPVKVDVLRPTGETLKLKDTRSNSQLIRALLYKKWLNAGSDIEFSAYYDKVSSAIMVNMDRITDMADVV